MKTRIRQGLLAGLALAAILVMPGIGGAAADNFSTLSTNNNNITVSGSGNSVVMDAAGTLSSSADAATANQAISLTIGAEGTFTASASNALNVNDGGLLKFEDGSVFIAAAGGLIVNDGGTITLEQGAEGISNLGDLLDKTNLMFTNGVINLNIAEGTTLTALPVIDLSDAAAGEFNIRVAAGAELTTGTAAAINVGGADLVFNQGGGNTGTLKVTTVDAKNLTIHQGGIDADGTNPATPGFNATGAVNIGSTIQIKGGINQFDLTVAAGDAGSAVGTIQIEGGDNTFTGAVTAHDDNSDGGQLEISGGTNTFASTATVTAGDITISGGANSFAGNLTAGTSGSKAGNINISAGDNTFDNLTLTANKDAGEEGGGIDFTGGANTFLNTVNLAASAVDDNSDPLPITIGATTFNLANGATLTANQDLVFNGATLRAQGTSALNLSAASKNITVSGTTIDLGTSELTVTAESVNVNGGNTIRASISDSGTDNGKLTVVTSNSGGLTIAGANKLELVGERGSWTGKELMDLSNVDGDIVGDPGKFSFTGTRYELIFHEDTGILEIGEAKAPGLDEVVGSANMTPNLQAASGMIISIIESEKNPDLAARLEAAIDGIAGLENEADMIIAASQLIGESTLGARQAAAESAFKTQGAVLGRLDKIHSLQGSTPPAAGDRPDNNRLWLGGFGSWNKQKNADDVFGYDYNLSGLALGYDHELDGAPLTLGVVSSLSFGKIENNNGRDSIETDTVSLGVYGSYRFESGLFVDANLGYGHSRNESTVNWVLGGQKTGNFDIDSWQAGARTGYIFDLGGFNLTPSLGLRYLNTKQGAWSESLDQAAIDNSAVANKFGDTSDSQLEIPLHLTANTTIDAGGLLLTPELRLGVNYAAQRADNELQMGFVGADETITLQGVKPPRTSFLAGAGLKIKLNDTMDVFVNYDLTTASGFTGHNASAGLGFQF